MENFENETAYGVYSENTAEKKNIGECIEDFFTDYGNTLITCGTYLALTAVSIGSLVLAKRAAKNGLVVNVYTPFPFKNK